MIQSRLFLIKQSDILMKAVLFINLDRGCASLHTLRNQIAQWHWKISKVNQIQQQTDLIACDTVSVIVSEKQTACYLLQTDGGATKTSKFWVISEYLFV